jgi:hypothetical protein
MRNTRFHPPKCRGKVKKMELLYTHSPKLLGPSPNFQKYKVKNKKILNLLKKGGQPAI